MKISDQQYLITVEEIRALMARYVYLADSKDWKSLSDLFTSEGTFTPLDVSGDPIIEMKGRESISSTISSSVKDAVAIHHLFSYEVDVLSTENATGIFAMEDYLIFPESTIQNNLKDGEGKQFKSLHGFGHYHGKFIKLDDQWYISQLIQTRLKLDLTY